MTTNQLEDLYCELAAHLMTCPAIQEHPPFVDWLADRVLTGFPGAGDYAAYNARHRQGTFHESSAASRLMGKFSWCDVSHETSDAFARSMNIVCRMLHDFDQPVFPKEADVILAHEHWNGRSPVWLRKNPDTSIK